MRPPAHTFLEAAILAGSFLCVLSTTALAHPKHDELYGINNKTSRTYLRMTEAGAIDTFTVEWIVDRVVSNKETEYTGTIEFPANPRETVAISLYSIYAQARQFAVTILSVTAESPEIGVVENNAIVWRPFPAEGVPLDPTRRSQQDASVDPNKVRFLKFSGKKCVIKVVSARKLHRPDRSDGFGPSTFGTLKMLNSHDTTPPPPDPGGPDGESDN